MRSGNVAGHPAAASAGAAGSGASSSASIRWDDDVVFRARPNWLGGSSSASGSGSGAGNFNQKRFINDTIRSDFHRKFIEKYMR